jgi:hypothetical protein
MSSRHRSTPLGNAAPVVAVVSGPEPPFGAPPSLSLEEMRKRMLFRQRNDLILAESQTSDQSSVLVGRSIYGGNSPPNPRGEAAEETDPHRLFQLLRRKKRNQHPSLSQLPCRSNTTPVKKGSDMKSPSKADKSPSPLVVPSQSPPVPTPGTSRSPHDKASVSPAHSVSPQPMSARDVSPLQPLDAPIERPSARRSSGAAAAPAGTGEAVPAVQKMKKPVAVRQRQANSARPASPPERKLTVRDVRSAHPTGATHDGRPCTRQKRPCESLDLFTENTQRAANVRTANPFPKQPLARTRSMSDVVRRTSLSEATPAAPTAAPAADFRCLFVSGDDDFDGQHEEFPSPKAQVDIPLIETDWFSAEGWEQVPAEGGHDVDLDDDDDATAKTQALYEMLVAQKHHRKSI